MSSWGKNNDYQTPKNYWSVQEAKEKIQNFCAYQERCAWEVRRKLFEKGIQEKDIEELLEFLTQEGYLDEERFARSFARGKFRLKKWGKNRIQQELRLRKISQASIRAALVEIDPEEYYDTLLTQTEKKWESTQEKDPFKKRFKVIQYLMSRGFEQDLIQEAIGSMQ
ncbi:regulatory protein RecX [Algoriphagus taiwanensis]|uniref:Regulatory protein RecX n=1 Tax=Algoriphagus taiwanensis TaxID=1445656 RepID=A0ABQ6Q2A1_9BACT|nr:regulatory protein RecX [Algoriphagus taiwanensis]